jgi:predicted dehydrogenase
MFAGTPERVYAEKLVDHEGDGVDLRLAATLRMPNGVLAQFDVGLDLVRRDELELIGIEGRIAVGDPWLCRDGYVELTRDGRTERLPVDPEGRFALTGQEEDVYRIEFDTTSAFITGELESEFGREDAVEQAAVLEAIRESADTCVPVTTGGRCDLRSD